MSKKWIVIDTNIFVLAASIEKIGSAKFDQSSIHKMSCALEFLERVENECEQYGLALDDEPDDDSSIYQEYKSEIPAPSLGADILEAIINMGENKKWKVFHPKRPEWLVKLAKKQGKKRMGKNDERFIGTALATPDKVLVSEDSVFHNNADLFREKGIQLYDVEEASERL